MKKTLVILVALILSVQLVGQESDLLNPPFSLIRSNPSFAGSNGAVRGQFQVQQPASALGRNNYSSYVGFDAYVKALGGGLALTASQNQFMNFLSYSQINLVYAPVFNLADKELRIIPSVQVSYLRGQMDGNMLAFGGLYPQNMQPTTRSNASVSGGLLVQYKQFNVGGTVFHMNQPDVGFYTVSKLPALLRMNASYNWNINSATLLNVTGLCNLQQNVSNVTLVANLIFLKHVQAAAGITVRDQAFVNLGYCTSYFNIVAGYGISVSALSPYNYGTYQLSMGLRLPGKKNEELPRTLENW